MIGPDLQWDDPQLEGASWQGIRYLELVSSTQLLVHLALAADGFEQSDVSVSGPDPIAYTVSFPEDGGGNRLARIQIDFVEPGGHGTWYVSLEAPYGVILNPFFALADFVFAIQCDAGDCRPLGATATTELAKAPELDLLTKDYQGFLTLLADRIGVSNRSWSDLAPASLERVLVELLAHHGDALSYYQDRVANEAFLDTATQRFSLAQHALLLGQTLREHQAARTLLAITVTEAGELPAGARVRMPRRPSEAAVIFTVAETRRVEPGHDPDDLLPAQWPGASTATIPVGARSLLLWGHHDELRVDDRLALVQGSTSEVHTLARIELLELPGWTDDPEQALTTDAVDVTRVHFVDALANSYRVWSPEQPLRVHGNLVEARAGELRRAVLPTSESGALQREDVELRLSRQNAVITRDGRSGTARWLLRSLRVPEGPVLWDLVDPDDVDGEQCPALEVEVDGTLWSRQDHLHRSRAYDQHYTVSSDERGFLWIHFGDDRKGEAIGLSLDSELGLASAEPELELVLRYRVGSPAAGNIALGKLTELVRPADPESQLAAQLAELGTIAVTNVIPGSGGRAADSLAAIRESIPAALRGGLLERAVTLEDYAAVAKQADERVERATALALGGVFNTVVVLVDERDAEQLSDSLRATVQQHLDARRMAGREVIVRAPEYVPIDVRLAVCAETGVARDRLRDRILAALRPGSLAAPGYFHPDRLSFGEAVELGDLLAFVQQLAGVRSVKALRFRRLHEPSSTEVFSTIELEPIEVARLDADELEPEHGRLRVEIFGLDQNIDDSAWAIEQAGS